MKLKELLEDLSFEFPNYRSCVLLTDFSRYFIVNKVNIIKINEKIVMSYFGNNEANNDLIRQ